MFPELENLEFLQTVLICMLLKKETFTYRNRSQREYFRYICEEFLWSLFSIHYMV